MQIGEVAERTGLSLRTIRYYEEVGLVTPSARTPGGFRVYTEADATRLELVKRMKSLEFTLEETRLLFAVLGGLAAEPTAQERRELVDQLATWCTEIDWRCALLREHLQIAEGLATSLDREFATQTGWPKAPTRPHKHLPPGWAGEAEYERGRR
ncbi:MULTISPECIES: MerR family transcriptional regulator [Actinomadura]|uniref:MerR family transcriptional regulator n=1 Tax=Actinomadura TaxID=1988 RepID=UPI0003AD502C|nr:MerR family transcriptional regulator [Actinomadura madurae]